MDAELERTIIHYYPQRALVSPLDNQAISWDYDTNYATLKALLADLRAIDPQLKLGTRGRYDISEEVVLVDGIRLQLSYLGPFAALNYKIDRELDEDEREVERRVLKAFDKHGIRVLPDEALAEQVPWIQHGAPKGAAPTVWDTLFVLPEG